MRNYDRAAATIYDIAKLAGVSVCTVSRTLNNKGYIAEETRERILRIAEELEYVPNPVARSLKTQRTNQIMLSMPYLRDYFNFDIIEAVQEVAKANGYSLLLNFTEDDEKKEIQMLNDVRENLADGLIMLSVNFTKEHLEVIKNNRFPFVLTCISSNRNKEWEEAFDFVGVDTQKGIYASTMHLIELGHKEIGYVGLPTKQQQSDERYTGYRMAMEAAGLKVNKKFVVTGDYKENFGYEAGKYFAELDKLPTAICASTDMIVLGLYRAFEEKGIKIPEDISIVGMDNIDVATRVKPKITTVDVAQSEIGKTAADLLFRRLDDYDGPYISVVYQPKLIIRESSSSVGNLL